MSSLVALSLVLLHALAVLFIFDMAILHICLQCIWYCNIMELNDICYYLFEVLCGLV